LCTLDFRRVDEVKERQAIQHRLDDVDIRADTTDGLRACLERPDQPSLGAREECVDEPCAGLARASRRLERGRHLRAQREVLAEAFPDALRDGNPSGGRLLSQAFSLLSAEMRSDRLLHGIRHPCITLRCSTPTAARWAGTTA